MWPRACRTATASETGSAPSLMFLTALRAASRCGPPSADQSRRPRACWQ
jgi:hypothetical protein